jgi:outer membrane lipoprotein LolB
LTGWRDGLRRGVAAVGIGACVLLTACATPIRARAPVDRTVSEYALAGRFSLREAGNSYSGRVRWNHDMQGNLVMVQDPFGGGVAELSERPQGARMTLADGRLVEAPSAQILMHELTGIALPVSDLARWLTGRESSGASVERDAAGRAVRFARAGWRVDYSYDAEDPDALPARIVAVHSDGLELRLRVESWELPQ